MTDKKKEEYFDCEPYCKMTSEIRNSKFCTKKSKIINGKVYFGCTQELSKEPPNVQQFYKCLLWDMGLKDSCDTCMLSCSNNKNEKFKKAIEKKRKLHKLVKKLEPNMLMYGINAQDIEKISEKYANSEDGEMGDAAIRAAEVAQKALYSALNGAPIDISYLSLYAQQSNKQIKKMALERQKKKKKKTKN